MKKTTLCILAILIAVALVATPVAAGIYTDRIPNIRYAISNTYSLGSKDMSSRLPFISAVQSFNFKPISPSGFTGSGTGITLSTGQWGSLFG